MNNIVKSKNIFGFDNISKIASNLGKTGPLIKGNFLPVIDAAISCLNALNSYERYKQAKLETQRLKIELNDLKEQFEHTKKIIALNLSKEDEIFKLNKEQLEGIIELFKKSKSLFFWHLQNLPDSIEQHPDYPENIRTENEMFLKTFISLTDCIEKIMEYEYEQ